MEALTRKRKLIWLHPPSRSSGTIVTGIMILGLISCQPGTFSSTVVDKATSPDGRSVAILLDRTYHVARVSDEFFLIVIPKTRDDSAAINARAIGDSAVLIATWAGKVTLGWRANDTLAVSCDSCGLRAIDVSRKLNHIGQTKIIYEGFPAHTAYS